MILLIALYAAPGWTAEPTTGREALAGLLRASLSSVDDFRCDFEGTQSFPRLGEEDRLRLNLGPGGLYRQYSGTLLMRDDGAYRTEVHIRATDSRSPSLLAVASSEGVYEDYGWAPDFDPSGSAERKPDHYSRFDRPETFGRIFLLPSVLGYLEDESQEMVEHGTEDVDGRPCRVIGFIHKPLLADDRTPRSEDRFWLDLERGGHPLQRRMISPEGNLARSVGAITLAKFEPASGQVFWLPVSGVVENYVSMKDEEPERRVYVSSAVTRETLGVVAGTVRFNTHPQKGVFRIKPRDGAIINDRIKNLRHEAGQDLSSPPTSRAQAEEKLRTELARADAQRHELKAASRERSGPGWGVWVPWAIAGASIVGLLSILYRNRR